MYEALAIGLALTLLVREYAFKQEQARFRKEINELLIKISNLEVANVAEKVKDSGDNYRDLLNQFNSDQPKS